MTDGGTAFPQVANYFKLNHVLCVHHFQGDIDTLKLSAFQKLVLENYSS